MATLERSNRICKTCRDERVSHGHAPRYLLILPSRLRNGARVLACPYCDGPVVEMAKKRL